MRVGSGRRCLVPFAIAALACVALLGPDTAGAATVVNGNFEAGSLKGWQVHRATEAGNWFAYKGTEAPIGGKRGADPVQPPPQGTFAAIADEANPETATLYQDVALEPGVEHRLSLLAYYNTYDPLVFPSPDTLSVDDEVLGGQPNQQFRIDVMKPEAPIESIDPADVLVNVFRTKASGPATMTPTKLTADLTPFAGQTVRIRVTIAAHEEVLNAGVDAVAIDNSSASGSPPSGSKPGAPTRVAVGKAKANRKNGTVALQVDVPGPGRLTAKAKKLIKPASLQVKGAGTVTLRLKPTPSARKTLQRKHKLRAKVAVTYEPSKGASKTETVSVLFKLKPRRHG
jgi:hypothetical protein